MEKINNGYKYNSKYSNLTSEEIMEKKREMSKERREMMSEDKKGELRERIRELNKKQDKSGECEVCKKVYKDIYQHRRGKKHKGLEKGGK